MPPFVIFGSAHAFARFGAHVRFTGTLRPAKRTASRKTLAVILKDDINEK